MRKLLAVIFTFFLVNDIFSQSSLEGHVSNGGERMAFVDIFIKEKNIGLTTNSDGKYHLELEPGNYTVRASFIGYKSIEKQIALNEKQRLHLDFNLVEDIFGLDQVVVTSTRNEISRRESPVSISVLGERIFSIVEASTLSQGLSFSPGLRFDLNCSNCGLPDVKMNGLNGAYTQILIDGRPVYSALGGVYGLEQIPANMIQRVEVVKGGGSSLYGANAIAGTINVITKDPIENSFLIGEKLSLIDNQTPDNTVTFNASVVADDFNSGASFFGNMRKRGSYDYNGDGFSELSKINTYSFGSKAYYKPSNLSRIGVEAHFINDFRRGGNMLDKLPHQTDVTEQTDHDIVSAQLSYETYNNSLKDKFSGFLSFQTINRKSYYGGGGNSDKPEDLIKAASYYGDSFDLTLVGGLQYAHNFINSAFTGGLEFKHNGVIDKMAGYNRCIDQKVDNYSVYSQYEYKAIKNLTLLFGGRYDYIPVNGIYDYQVISSQSDINLHAFTPRLSLMYNISNKDQVRFTYAKGFRPPQAFDEDLHLETIGGEAKVVYLNENLQTETSNSYTLAYEKNIFISSSTVDISTDLFYTELLNPFINVPLLTDNSQIENAILVEKRNGHGAKVYGLNIEVNSYLNSNFNFQLGATIQKSLYNKREIIIEGEDINGETVEVSSMELMKAPNNYGYFTLQYLPSKNFTANLSGIYTGSMLIPNQNSLDIRNTPEFFDLGITLAYEMAINKNTEIEFNAGVQNLINSYQSDFEYGVEKDAGYVYGPAQPRTVFLGVKIGNL